MSEKRKKNRAHYSQEVFINMGARDKFRLSTASLLKLKHERKNIIEHFSMVNGYGECSDGPIFFHQVDNRSRIYICAHGNKSEPDVISYTDSYGCKRIMTAWDLASSLARSLTNPSVRNPTNPRKLKISLLVCYGGIGTDRDVTGVEKSFAVSLHSSLWRRHNIYCEVVGRCAVTVISRDARLMLGGRVKWVDGHEKKNIKGAKMMVTNRGGDQVIYDEHEESLYDLVRHTIIPEFRTRMVETPNEQKKTVLLEYINQFYQLSENIKQDFEDDNAFMTKGHSAISSPDVQKYALRNTYQDRASIKALYEIFESAIHHPVLSSHSSRFRGALHIKVVTVRFLERLYAQVKQTINSMQAP